MMLHDKGTFILELIEIVLTFVQLNLLSDDVVIVHSHPHDVSILRVSHLDESGISQMILNLHIISEDLYLFFSND